MRAFSGLVANKLADVFIEQSALGDVEPLSSRILKDRDKMACSGFVEKVDKFLGRGMNDQSFRRKVHRLISFILDPY